ncbi:MAG: hypothetical protein AAGH45_11700 [Pseudomonadota bacterium]
MRMILALVVVGGLAVAGLWFYAGQIRVEPTTVERVVPYDGQ